MHTNPLPKLPLLGLRISVGSFQEHVDAIATLGAQRRSSYVCCVNAHMTVEARQKDFAKVVSDADLATADGMPVRYALNLFHRANQPRVAGNDLMPALLQKAERDGLSVFLFGNEARTQRAIMERASKELPRLRFAGQIIPPFGPIQDLDMSADAARINDSGAHIVLVSLGCPKQERWMALMKGRVNAVMIGLGGAFRLYAGEESRAPKWMRTLALEWAYRLAIEPGRLWKRYLITNGTFILLFAREGLQRLIRPLRRNAA